MKLINHFIAVVLLSMICIADGNAGIYELAVQYDWILHENLTDGSKGITLSNSKYEFKLGEMSCGVEKPTQNNTGAIIEARALYCDINKDIRVSVMTQCSTQGSSIEASELAIKIINKSYSPVLTCVKKEKYRKVHAKFS